MKKEAVLFRKDIQPGEKVTLSERVKDIGHIVEIRLKFYDGSEGSFHVQPYVLHTAQLREEIVTYPDGGNQYISGNNDYFVFPVFVSVGVDDEIKVFVENTTIYKYTLVCDVIVQYMGEERGVTR